MASAQGEIVITLTSQEARALETALGKLLAQTQGSERDTLSSIQRKLKSAEEKML